MNASNTLVAINTVNALAEESYYRVLKTEGRWTINRVTDEKVLCLCRNEKEAVEIANSLNQHFSERKHPRR